MFDNQSKILLKHVKKIKPDLIRFFVSFIQQLIAQLISIDMFYLHLFDFSFIYQFYSKSEILQSAAGLIMYIFHFACKIEFEDWQQTCICKSQLAHVKIFIYVQL